MAKNVKLIVIFTAFALIAISLFISNLFFGNPISKHIAENAVQEYVDENYKEFDLIKSPPIYVRHLSGYIVNLHSESVENVHFEIRVSMFGQITKDFYQIYTSNSEDFLFMLSNEYTAEVSSILEEILSREKFADCSNINSSSFLLSGRDIDGGFDNAEGGIDVETLNPKSTYDVQELAKDGGFIDIRLGFKNNNLSYENTANAILYIKEELETSGINFSHLSFYVYKNDREIAYYLENLKNSEIYEEGFSKRIEEMAKSTE